jgi:UDPglucose 6-dehydrogenase
MKVACVGTGFVGVVTSAVIAKLGHQVVGLDIDEDKVASLHAGQVPFFEPGLSELLIETQQTGNLSFTTSYKEAIQGAEIVIIMVGTPSAKDGTADLKYVFAACESLAPHLDSGAIVVLKSTVPPGTNAKVSEVIAAHSEIKFEVASVPEFLKEGTAVADTLHPDRVIIGSTNPATITKLKDLHQPLTDNIIVMQPESAQMAKYAANVYLAMRITFANQIADLCEKNGADIQEVLLGIGADSRIGSHYWYPGMGYGGSCFPKDVREIAAYAKSVGEKDSIFIAVDERNEARIPRLMEQYDQLVGGFQDKTVAVLGLSFKPNTNDTRESPASYVIPWLNKHSAKVVTCDPQVPADTTDPYQAANNAHVLMLLVEWDDYLKLNFDKLNSLMQDPKYLIDTRNQYDGAMVAAAGLKYKGVGR